ncbi:MAG: DUF4345 domain-containing protein [Caulobacteraceae bacterium]
MNASANRRALQIAIAVAGLVPVGAGLAGVLMGPRFAGLGAHGDLAPVSISLDSHFRYLSGLLLAIGLLFWNAIRTIERQGSLVRALTLVVFVGGLSRAVSLLQLGPPDGGMRFGLVMELIVTPLICLWQSRVQAQVRAQAGLS